MTLELTGQKEKLRQTEWKMSGVLQEEHSTVVAIGWWLFEGLSKLAWLSPWLHAGPCYEASLPEFSYLPGWA